MTLLRLCVAVRFLVALLRVQYLLGSTAATNAEVAGEQLRLSATDGERGGFGS